MNYTPNDDAQKVYKNIVKTQGGRYKIVKAINGKFTDFGTYITKTNAVYDRDLLDSVDWDYDLLCEMELNNPPFTDDDLPHFPGPRSKGGRPSGGLFGFKGVQYNLKRNYPWTRVWKVSVTYNRHRNFISHFNDPLSGEIVYDFIRNEIDNL